MKTPDFRQSDPNVLFRGAVAATAVLALAGCASPESETQPTAPTTSSATSETSPTHKPSQIIQECDKPTYDGHNYSVVAHFGKLGGTAVLRLTSEQSFTVGDQYVANAHSPSDIHGGWMPVQGYGYNQATKMTGDDGATLFVVEMQNSGLGSHEETIVTSGANQADINCETIR